MTPYELALSVEAYQELKEADLKERLSLVWLGEYYHRVKKMPSLKSELNKVAAEKKRHMSNDEMLETVKKLNKHFGGSVIKGGD
jgi:hypothetical protein